MKKTIIFLLVISLVLSFYGCSPKNSTTEDETINTTKTTEPQKDAVSVDKNTITMGNFLITLPDGFTITSFTENSASVSSADGLCYIGVFAADVSELPEEDILEHLPSQHESFMTPGATRGEPKEQTVKIGPYKLTFNLYAEIDTDSIDTINMDGSFTDSWYTYTVLYRCYAEADVSSYTYSFAEFCGNSKYIGLEPRFNAMQ